MGDKNMLLELLRADGSITVNKSLIQAIGLNEAVLYCELLSRHFYFEARGMLDNKGYFYNTQYDLQAGTGMGEKAQRTAITKLKKLNLIDMEVKGLPPKRHFKINTNIEVVNKLLIKGKAKLKAFENSTNTSEGGNLKLPKEQLIVAEGSGNNTYNNTKSIILKYVNVVASASNCVFFSSLFSYYLDAYKNHTNKDHPILSHKHVETIINNIEAFSDTYEIYKLTDWEQIIDMYFSSNLDCDRNMIHFTQEEILYNRASNCNLI